MTNTDGGSAIAAQASCTYIIKANCGSPGFKVQSGTNLANSEVKLHYLEWDTDNSGFTQSTTYTGE